MKAKNIKLIGCTIIALSILVSCESDDGYKDKPYIRGEDYGWGYMHGMVENLSTGEKYPVNHEQHPSLEKRQFFRDEFKYRPELNRHVQIRTMNFYYNDREAHNRDVGKRPEEVLQSYSFLTLRLVDDFRIETIRIVDSNEYVKLDDGSFALNINSSISIKIYDDENTANQWGVKPLVYIPDKNNPFIVQLTAVEFNGSYPMPPIIEGYFRGILHREDDPDDRMMVDMRFGM